MLYVRNVSIRFGNGPEAVSGTSFALKERDKLVVVGETGSGKSVLLLAALRLLPKSAQVSGEILFEGRNLLGCSRREMTGIRGTRISYIPQGSGNGLNPLYTVGHQMSEAIGMRQRAQKRELLSKSAELLSRFGFSGAQDLCKAYPFMLSGGMRQRVLIAMAIAADAKLIFADEPTKGLDSRRIGMVVDAFRALSNRTILCVTHDLRFAKAIATKIVVMYASQQIESACSGDFFEKPLHPYSQAMLGALPENGLHAKMGFAPPRADEKRQSGCRFCDRCPERHEKCTQQPPLFRQGDRKVRCWLYADADERSIQAL